MGTMSKLLFLLFLAPYLTLAMNDLEEFVPWKYSYQELLIFLDNTEQVKNKILIEGFRFLQALFVKNTPILVSTAIAKNIFTNEAYTDLLVDEKFESIFKEESWTIKEMSNDLLCFIPDSFIRRYAIDRIHPMQQFSPINKDIVNEFYPDLSEATELELYTGLKINHAQTISFDEMLQKETQLLHTPANYFIDLLYKNGKSGIFCTKSDYVNKTIPIPNWAIYMAGHGNIDKAIVFLSLDDFKQTLHFFAHQINVRLLVYSSCYAAGVNADTIYRESEKNMQRVYPFSIITAALTDTVTAGPIEQYAVLHQNPLRHFITDVSNKMVFNYADIVNHLFSVRTNYIGNTAQVKLAGTEWFMSLQELEKIVSIGNILVKSRNPKDALDVVAFFKKYPNTILLYASDIPFELIIHKGSMRDATMRAIVSMIPERSFIHILKKVTSGYPLDTTIKWFMPFDWLGTRKIFFVKEIDYTDLFYRGTASDIIIYNDYQSKNRETGEPAVYMQKAFFKDDDQLIVLKSDGRHVPEQDDLILYEKLLEEVNQEIQNADRSMKPALLPLTATREDIAQIEWAIKKQQLKYME